MIKIKLFLIIVLLANFTIAQNLKWSSFLDTSTTFSSARAVDLNNDNILDIVIGGGLDGQPESNGVNAINGLDGSVLWNFHTDEEMFGSAQFMDITGDNVNDVFIGGRYAEFYAIDGSNGSQIWEFFPYSPNVALDSGWFNFYNPQFIPDQNSDGVADILVANGGNHSAPPWDTLREPGMLMVLDAMTGSVLAKDTMPDGKETYCSPVVMDYLGQTYIIYGSGGENDRGALWRVKLVDLMSNDISNSQMLASDPDLGFIAPSSLADMNNDGVLDIINQAYDGTIRCFNGTNGALIWEVVNPGTESSSGPTIGNFTGNDTPDVFNVVYAGAAPSFYEFYQILIDGATGQVAWLDSLGAMHYGSSSAVDLNGDGRDEVIASVDYHNGVSFSHQLLSIDFQNDNVTPFYLEEPGVNLASTVLIEDLDGNGYLDFTFAYRADSFNPMAQNGFYVKCLEDQHPIPGVGIAWGGYMGTKYDGVYNYQGMNCGTVIAGATFQNISCNHFADASISLNPSGGVAPYTYLWSTGEIVDSIGGLDVGTYTVTVTDSVGCIVEAAFNASDPYLITFGAIASPTCPGDSTGTATVNSSGCPCMFSTCVFDWDSGDSTKTATSLWEGWQYITITHMDGCIVEDSVFVPNSYPVLDSLISNDIQCATDPFSSSSIQLYLHNEPLTDISWNTGDTLGYIDSLNSGSYYFDLMDDRGCFYSDTVIISAADTIQISLSVTGLQCFEDSTGSVNSMVSGGFSDFEYNWNNGDSSASISNLHSGWYSLIITDSVGCQSISDSVYVDEPTPLSVTAINISNDSTGLCDGAAIVEMTGGTLPYSYSWNDPLNTMNDTVTGLCAGVYTVIMNDANGCSYSDTIEIINTVDLLEYGLAEISVFPNPFIDHVEISTVKEFYYELIDSRGRVVLFGNEFGDKKIDTSKLTFGTYQLRLSFNDAIILYNLIKTDQ